jgi:hypothetical protein
LYAFDGEGQRLWMRDLGASVWGLALAADGGTLAAGTSGREALLLDGAGNVLWKREVPGIGWWAWVWAAALSADGQTVAMGTASKSVLVLDRGGNELGEHKAQADVFAVAVAEDGGTIAAGSSDQQVYLLDRQGRLLWRERLEDKVWAVDLSADGRMLVVGAGEQEAHVRTFDRQGRPLWKRYVEGSVSCSAVSPGGEVVVAGTREGHVHVFDGAGEPLAHAVASQMMRDVAVSRDGQTAVAGSRDGQVMGFLLPPRPAPAVEPAGEVAPHASKYEIHIGRAEGVVIGDGARMTQNFNSTDEGEHRNVPEQVAGTEGLRQLLIERLDLEELRTLCADIEVDFDSLRGEGKAAKARELVLFLERRRDVGRLVDWLRRHRADVGEDLGRVLNG